MTFPLNLRADLHVHINNHLIRVIGRDSSIVLKFKSVRAFTVFFLHGGKPLTSGAMADQLNQFLGSTGMTIYVQHRAFPVAGANAKNIVSRVLAWLLRMTQ